MIIMIVIFFALFFIMPFCFILTIVFVVFMHFPMLA